MGVVTIKEYAKQSGKSVQAVYKQMSRKENSQKLEGHVLTQKIGNKDTKVLDEEAVRILDEASRQAPQVVLQTEDKELIEQLQQENKALLLKITDLQDALLKEKDTINQLEQEKSESQKLLAGSDAKVEILEAQNTALEERLKEFTNIEDKRKWWQFWK